MKTDQKFTPKYWVGHSKHDDDVLLHTARKNMYDCYMEMDALYGEDWIMDDDFEIILVEIREKKT